MAGLTSGTMVNDLQALQLEEEDDDILELELPESVQPVAAYPLCAVGTFITKKRFNFNVMKNRMAAIWQPGRGISIEDLGNRLVLFRFYSKIDLWWVLDNGPWTFDDYLLVLHELKEGDEPTLVPLHRTAFWVQVLNLAPGLFSEAVGKAIGGYIGSFISYDSKNAVNFTRSYMRIRVSIDVTKPLKKGNKVRTPGQQ